MALLNPGDGQAGDNVCLLRLVGALELVRYLRLGLILALEAGSGDGVGHNQVHLNGDVGVQADLHNEGVGEGAEGKLRGSLGAVAGHGEGREHGAGKNDVLGGRTGVPGRGLLFSLARADPGTHNSLGHFGGAKVIDIHCRKSPISNAV